MINDLDIYKKANKKHNDIPSNHYSNACVKAIHHLVSKCLNFNKLMEILSGHSDGEEYLIKYIVGLSNRASYQSMLGPNSQEESEFLDSFSQLVQF